MAMVFLGAVFVAALCADFLAPHSYEEQFREAPAVRPSARFPLGTDELGRDRLSRLLYGTRVSLVLAPAAALFSTALAVLLGIAAALSGRRAESVFTAAFDTMLSLPWLFLILIVRAALPLNVSPVASVLITFLLLGWLGWAGPGRVVKSSVHRSLRSDSFLFAEALGCSRWRLVSVHLVSNLYPVISAQFWLSVPLFLLSEANLGLLGLGVSQPLPSWGNLLHELENYSAIRHYPEMLVPAVLLVLVVCSCQVVLPSSEAM